MIKVILLCLMLAWTTDALALFIEVPIIGKGTREDPFRPDIPLGVTKWAASIPTQVDGSPKGTTCIVWVPDTSLVSSAILRTKEEATTKVLGLDPKLNMNALEQKK